MHERFSKASHIKFKILKIFLWHTDKSGYFEPLNCEYCNYLADFRVFSFVSFIFGCSVFVAGCRLEENILSNARSRPWRVRYGLRLSSSRNIYFRSGKFCGVFIRQIRSRKDLRF